MYATYEMPSDERKARILSLFWWMPAAVGVLVLVGRLI
jgi:hypothetical protein